MTALSVARITNFQIGLMIFLISLLSAQYIRAFVRVRTKKLRLYHAPRNKVAELKPYATLLELIRTAGFPHASVLNGGGGVVALRSRFELVKCLKAYRPHLSNKLKFYHGSPRPDRFVSPDSSTPQIVLKLLLWLNWKPSQSTRRS